MTRDQLCFRVLLCLLLFGLFTYGPATGADIAPDAPVPVRLLPIVADKMVPSNHAPGTPYPLQPLDGVTDHDPDSGTLHWQSIDPDGDVLVYDVLFEADDPTPDEYLVRETGYQQVGAVLWGSTDYYWQVVSRDQRGGVSPSPVWHFSTAPCDNIWLNYEITDLQGLEITLDTRVSSRCSNITKIEWDWGDGVVESIDNPETDYTVYHTYPHAGLFDLNVVVYNDQGITQSRSLKIYLGPTSGVCDYVTEIPKIECDALIALYDATDGENWNIPLGWGTYITPCERGEGWEGVECVNGHVDSLMLWATRLSGDIPPEIGDLSELTTLVLDSNPITSIPSEIGNLGQLTWLSLHQTQISQLPPQIGNLANLENLGLGNTNLASLPAEIGNLSQLTQLSLDGTPISQLPPEFGNLMNLESLGMWGTNLTSLPAEFGNLSALVYLNLNDNPITYLPEEFGNLANLGEFRIQANALITLPESIGNLSSLTLLDLVNNQLMTLPETIGNLKVLESLDVSGNPINSLPDGIGNCAGLRYLWASFANLTDLPASMGGLKQLWMLNVTGNNLTSLPAELGQCTALTILDVSNNALTELPSELGQLPALYSLQAEHNAINALPANIGDWDALDTLDLQGNALTSLPVSTGDMQTLRFLDVGDNPGLTGSVPDLLIPLPSLEYIVFTGTNWCEPATGPVAEWLTTLDHYDGTGISCEATSAIQICSINGASTPTKNFGGR